MRTETIRVQSMFCPHCETRLQAALQKLPGVKEAKASYEKGEIRVIYDSDISPRKRLFSAIQEEGYGIAVDDNHSIQGASILIILLASYVIAKHLGWTQLFNLFPAIEASFSLGMLFVIGLLTSVHCIAMCGGINLSQSVLSAQNGGNLLIANILYNIGRIASYTIVGAAAGAAGSVLSLSGVFKGLFAILGGVVMVIMALNMLGVFKPLRRLHLYLPSGPFSGLIKRFGGRSSFIIGLFNGLMPCGPLQSMQIYALSTGSVWVGALSMLLFSLGTVPLTLGFGLVSGRLNQRYTRAMLKVSALLVFVMGINTLSNGLSLSGFSLPSLHAPQSVMAMQIDGKQTVRTEIDYGSYPPIMVRAGIPLEWTIFVPEGKLNGCNEEIIIPAWDIRLKLHEGENLLRFLPQETGTVPYSCWMGMIRSSIRVIE